MHRWTPYLTHAAAALLALLASAVAANLPPDARADGPNDWPMVCHDPTHSGYNPNETALSSVTLYDIIT